MADEASRVVKSVVEELVLACGFASGFVGLLLDEGALDDVVAWYAHAWGYGEAPGVEQGGCVLEHGRTTANHCTVDGGVERRAADVFE